MTRRLPRSLLIALTLSALALGAVASPVAAAGVVRMVDDDGFASPGNCDGTNSVHKKIQPAINVSNPGDSIVVCPGDYVGRVKIKKNNITLRAFDPWTATIIAAPDHDSSLPLLWIKDANSVTVKWMSLRAPTEGTCQPVYPGLINVDHSPFSQIRANNLGIIGTAGMGPCGYGLGIWVRDGSRRTTLAYNTITDFNQGGISVWSKDVIVKANTLNFYQADSALGDEGIPPDGISAQIYADDVNITGNVIRALATAGSTTPMLGSAIKVVSRANPFIFRNNVQYVDTGITLLGTTGGLITENEIHDTTNFGVFYSGADDTTTAYNNVTTGYGGIFLTDQSNGNTIDHNDFSGHAYDCLDQSSGSGTGGTDNTWTNDIGAVAEPDPICDPAGP